MILFQKILVPLDGSEHSLYALEKAIQIARKFDGKLMLIHMYSMGIFELTPSQLNTYVLEHRKSGEKILEEGKKRAYAEGVPFETRLEEGHIVGGIVKAAKEGNFDLIVMGARGKSELEDLLLGSVSQGVMLHAPCPVLIVK